MIRCVLGRRLPTSGKPANDLSAGSARTVKDEAAVADRPINDRCRHSRRNIAVISWSRLLVQFRKLDYFRGVPTRSVTSIARSWFESEFGGSFCDVMNSMS